MSSWQVGDLALCVRGCSSVVELCDPLPGSINVVRDVIPDIPHILTGEEGIGLEFEGIFPPSCLSYDAQNFHKIEPLTDEGRREALRDLDIPMVPA